MDFDGTIVTEDIAERALSRFAAPGWMRFNGLLAEGKINVDECVRSEYGMITAHSKKEMIAYLRDHYHLRAGFRRFLQDCRFGRLEVAIVSAGLDFCIMDTFQTFGIDMPRLICPRSRLTRQGTIRLTFPRYRWPGSRDFKEDAVFSYKERGLRVAYVGDGAATSMPLRRPTESLQSRGPPLRRCAEPKESPTEQSRHSLPSRGISAFQVPVSKSR